MTIQVVEGIIGAIQKRIDEYEEIANDLAHDYIQSDKPFPTDLKARYDAISEVTEGLIEAVGIIMQGDYMKEENKRLHQIVETLSIIASFEVLDGKSREYYRNIAWNAILGARKALEGEQHGPSTD